MMRKMTAAEVAEYEKLHGHKVGEFLPKYGDPGYPSDADELKLCPSCLTRELEAAQSRVARLEAALREIDADACYCGEPDEKHKCGSQRARAALKETEVEGE